MKNSQKGFGAVEVLIFVVIAGLIGAVGWLAYDRQQKQSKETTPSTSQDLAIKPKEDTQKTKISTTKVTFSTYGIKLSIDIPEGWQYEGTKGYDEGYEYLIDIWSQKNDIQLSLQITQYEGSLHKQNILDKFVGFNGNEFYITRSLDETPGDDRYEQMGITACNNGHCVTKINDTYNLNANITPIKSNKTFSGSADNLELVKAIFTSIELIPQ